MTKIKCTFFSEHGVYTANTRLYNPLNFSVYKNCRIIVCLNIRTQLNARMHTHTHTIVLRLFWILSGTTRVSWYQKDKTRKVKPTWIYWSKR